VVSAKCDELSTLSKLVCVGLSGQGLPLLKTADWTTTLTDPEGQLIADGASAYGAGVGFVVSQPTKKGNVTLGRTLTCSLLGTSTFAVHYESTASPNFLGVYPPETFRITFYDPFGAPVHPTTRCRPPPTRPAGNNRRPLVVHTEKR
jgi:hypothetical protein